MRPRIPGFTMIEMMMVVGVIAVLALMAAPGYIEKIIRDQIIEAMLLADIAKTPVALAWAAGVPLPDDNTAAGQDDRQGTKQDRGPVPLPALQMPAMSHTICNGGFVHAG